MKGRKKNPFSVRWLEGWTFQLVLIGGKTKIEAYGYGICLSSFLDPLESPRDAADRLVHKENRRRKSLHQSWLNKNNKKELNKSCLENINLSTFNNIKEIIST